MQSIVLQGDFQEILPLVGAFLDLWVEFYKETAGKSNI